MAVVSVVLFHTGVPWLQGGFVGVDVFFVISGYLITQRVVASWEADDFSFGHFYARRARRLLPAAASTLVATLIAGMVLLEPPGIVRLAKSAVAAAFSASNVLFWSEAGYWDAAATSKPLLHTWSLAVEEQFYLVWPLLLVGLLAWRRRGAIVPLLGVGLASLVLTNWFTGVDSTGAFYLMPFRAYEFVAGAGIVWLDRRPWPSTTSATFVRVLLWMAGMTAILGSVAAYDDSTVFPGIAAALPAFGTAAVILARRPPKLDGLLSNKVAGQIGLRSYSLYLIHWPVLVFARVIHGPLDLRATLGAVALVIALSELQYRFIEKSMRWVVPQTSSDHPRGMVARAAAPAVLSMVLVAAVGATAIATDGFAETSPDRPTAPVVHQSHAPYAPDERALRSISFSDAMSDRGDAFDAICESGRIAASNGTSFCGVLYQDTTNVLVLGDSHAFTGINALVAAAPDVNILLDQRKGCPPLRDLTGLDDRDECSARNMGRFELIDSLLPDLDGIVISVLLEDLYGDLDRLLEETEATVAWMVQRWDVPIVVLGVGPYYEEHAFDLTTRANDVNGFDAELNKGLRQRIFATDRRLTASIEAAGAHYIDKLDWMCPGGVCRALVPGQSRWMVYDNSHLTGAASRAMGLALRDPLREALGLSVDPTRP